MGAENPIRSHRDLTVWRKAMTLRRQVHLMVLALPREARWDIGRHVERTALSIPSNIAEGHSRPDRQDYKQFLSMARGSVGELDTQLLAIAEDYPDVAAKVDQALRLLEEVSRMLTTLIKKL